MHANTSRQTNYNALDKVHVDCNLICQMSILCRKSSSGLLDCPWWIIACLGIIAVCLLMGRYPLAGKIVHYVIVMYNAIDFEVLDVLLQTGSGKTYTMMGEICQMDGKLNEDCGITPRIFEYLFTRISEVNI